jgi:tetratricopeptide (TPR) repeat protein
MSRLDLTPLDQPDPVLSYIFRHVLTHQVTYESQPYASRAELHGHFGYFLEREFSEELDRNVDLLAHHFDKSQELEKRITYLLKAGEQAQAEYANDAAISYYERLVPLLGDEAKIPVMLKLGQVYETVGQWKQEDDLFREGLELADRLGDAQGKASLESALGSLLRKRGEFADASFWLGSAQRGFEEIGDRAGIGEVLHELGTLSAQQGEFEAARAYYQASLEIRRELGENRKIGSLLSNLGILARMKNDYAGAERLYEEALELRREIGDRWGIAVSLNNLGVLKRYQGEFTEGREILTESLTSWREIGDQAFLANTLTSLGEVLIEEGDAAEAGKALCESLTINRALGDKRSIAFLLENFARVAFLKNEMAKTIQLISAARALRQSIGANLPAAEQASLDELGQNARQAMPSSSFNDLWSQGTAMSVEEAMDIAFSVT